MIPNLGTILTLTEPWTARIYFESRNSKFMDKLGLKHAAADETNPRYFTRNSYLLGEHKRNLAGNLAGNTAAESLLKIPEFVTYGVEKPMSEDQLENAFQSYKATNKKANPYIEVTFPVGTQLSVDRIYIRRGAESFNSVTFRTTKICPEKILRSGRFWVKLKDANKIVCDFIG